MICLPDKKPDYCHVLQDEDGINAYVCWEKCIDDGRTDAERLELFRDFGRDRQEISGCIEEHIISCQRCAATYEAVEDIRRSLENINEK